MRNPFIYSRSFGTLDGQYMTSQEIFDAAGNTGNMLFLSSVRRLVKHDQAKLGGKLSDEALEGADGIVIPAANWLQDSRDLGGLAKRLEKIDLPICIMGLGAQAIEERKIKLPEGSQRFLKVISERCSSLSVRGDFTAEVVASHGVKNVTVTGCPSFLWHVDRPAEVARIISRRAPLRVAVLITPAGDYIQKQPNLRTHLTRKLLQFAFDHGASSIGQTELPLMQVARSEVGADNPEIAAILEFLFERPADEAAKYLRKNFHLFANVPEWMTFSANHDLVLGTRLHGVVAGLLSGTPSVLVTHDTRTVEMGRQAGIPTIPAEEIIRGEKIDPDQIVKQSDFTAFNSRQRTYFKEFKDFLKNNDVPNRLADI
ncbi:polysaccharide pyruvyl transferase family protein [Sulfitobacter sp. EhC04]|uniref:polysaccharide pyruvyl transferase family protein n=1 Tax=Sulfitobacter sp. EhC04 TaxID=1849168 RepID=UPI0010FF08CB|nr:polysaccharide pyruvyl transferase family protein [Sulfitobacter sp. EhC04]